MAKGFHKFIRRIEGLPEVSIEKKPDINQRFYYNGDIEDVNERCILCVLDGEVEDLFDSFTWAHTPQGSPYWERRNSGVQPLSIEDHYYLNWLLLEVQEHRNQVCEPTTPF